MSTLDEAPPRVGRGVLGRASIAFALVMAMTAAAIVTAVFLQVDAVTDIVKEEGRAPISLPEIDEADVGGAQTLMILGSDERFGDKKLGVKARSDTIILVRLDKRNQAVSVMSLPRDLRVTIPGNSVPTKINAAYEQGGARLALRTVKKVLSTPEEPFRVNHLVTIGFESFQRAINYVGCVYADIDRRYFNDNSSGEQYAVIDVKPGYQKICGQDSLDYVRHRHTDNDLVRAARQQQFLREIKNQQGVRRLKDPRRLKELARIFSRYFDSDKGLRRRKELFALAKLVIFASEKPVQEVPFSIDGQTEDGSYLLASDATIRKTVERFMRGGVAQSTTTTTTARRRSTSSGAKRRPRKRTSQSYAELRKDPRLATATKEGQDQAIVATSKIDFPFYFPALKRAEGVLDGGLSSEPTTRTYTIVDEQKRRHRAYRMTTRINRGGYPEYYGIQGTSWKAPPALDDPDGYRTVNGRKLRLYYDGRKLRTVAWRTDRAVYWVSNTLLRALSNRQMLAIGGSLRRLGAR